jgi:nucleolin
MPRHKAVCRRSFGSRETSVSDDKIEPVDSGDEGADDGVDQTKTAAPPEQKNENDDALETLKRKRKRKRSNKANDASEGDLSNTPLTKDDTADGSTDVASSHYANEKTVYIEGLPYEATEDDVSNFFESCGRISSIRLPKW